MSNNSMTSEPTNQNHIQQTLFAGDFLVKTSAKPDCKPVSPKELGQVSFTNSSESFAWYDQNLSSWRTSQRSLITDWELYTESWPRQASIVNMRAYLQVHWEPVTNVIDSGLLPTPVASDVQGGIQKNVQYKNGHFFRENKQGVRWGVKLRDAVSILPTPTARDYKDSGENMNYKKAAKKRRLTGVIVESRLTQTGKDTNLNPHFVEEMMGYPIGYTDLKH